MVTTNSNEMDQMAGTTKFKLPHRGPGALSAAKEACYEADLDAFCEMILEIRSIDSNSTSARVAGATSSRTRPDFPREISIRHRISS